MLSSRVCTGEALGIGASELVLRSPLGSPNAHVHFSTGSAARRYLLRLEVTTHPDHPCRMPFTFVSTHVAWLCPQGVSARQKLLSLLTFVTGPEVLGVDLQEGSKALSPTMFLPTPEVPTPQPPSCKTH